jgi:hypothetical protein
MKIGSSIHPNVTAQVLVGSNWRPGRCTKIIILSSIGLLFWYIREANPNRPTSAAKADDRSRFGAAIKAKESNEGIFFCV